MTMTRHQVHFALESGDPEQVTRALQELNSILEVASSAILELAGREKLKTGEYPLTEHERVILFGFVGLAGINSSLQSKNLGESRRKK